MPTHPGATSVLKRVRSDGSTSTRRVPGTSLPVKSWKILYTSTTVAGKPTRVSGTVIMPTTPYRGKRPLVAYAPGTQGWGDQCAPSREMAAGDFDEQFLVDSLLAKGWAVVVTDYPGLGTPGDETYAVGVAEGHAVLDSLTAAQALAPAKLSRSGPVTVEGYSQGGGAAAWAAQQHHTYAPRLNLKGVANGGTPANMLSLGTSLDGSLFAGFLAGAAIGFNAAYPKLHLDSYLTADGKKQIAKLDHECQVAGLLQFAGKHITDLTKNGVNPINDPDWQRALDANQAGRVEPDVPVLQSHGALDEIIPYQQEVDLHKQWCAKGATAQLDTYPGDHVLTAAEAQPKIVGWLADRFAGKAAPSNC